MPDFLERSHQPLGDADVPHASARHQLEGVPLLVVLGLRLVHHAHAAETDGVSHRIRSQHEVLGLALEDALGLKRREDSLADEIVGENGRLKLRLILHEIAEDLIKPGAIEQVAATQVVGDSFTSS